MKKINNAKKKISPSKINDLDDVKEKILQSAIEVFAQNGFESTRTRDIAALAQVNISTLHYYFQSKDNIYRSVINKILDQSNKYMMPTMIEQQKIIDSTKDKKILLQAIKIMASTFIETVISPENKDYAKIIAFEQVEQSEHFQELFETVMNRVCAPFMAAVAKIINRKVNSNEVVLKTHALHSIMTSFNHSKSSLFYLTGWQNFDKKNIKLIKTNILEVIESMFQSYIKAS